MMLLPRKQVVPVTQRQTHPGINHCLCIQSVDPCITTGHEQWQETRQETGAGWGKGHSECQTGRFEERIQHAGNINCTVNVSCGIAAVTRRPFPVISVTFHKTLHWFALVFFTLKHHSTTSETQSPTGSFSFFLLKPF